MKHPKIKFSCQKFEYNKNTKKIIALENVIYQDKDKKIKTNQLIYNTNTKQGYFNNGGIITIFNHKLQTKEFYFNKTKQEGYFRGGGIMTNLSTGYIIQSQSGLMLILKKIYQLNNSVTIQNKNYTINSNKIIINNKLKHMNFFGPTIIKNKKNPSNYIYTELGYLCNNNFYFKKKSKIYYNNKTITGQYIYYNHKKKYGKILGNITFQNNNYIIKGQVGNFFESKNTLMMTKRAYSITKYNNNTLYMSADTLMINQQPIINNDNKYIVHGINNVRFFHSNIQAICDSIKINELKGIIAFYKKPIIWIHNNQITSNKIIGYLNVKNKNLDSIYFTNNAFLINQSNFRSKKEFNQIQSDQIISYLKNNKIFQILSIGNSKSIIHLYNKNKKIGVNKSKSNTTIINININNNHIQNILYKTYVQSKLYPHTTIPNNKSYLKNFKWRDNERMTKWNDIFIKKNKINTPYNPPKYKKIKYLL